MPVAPTDPLEAFRKHIQIERGLAANSWLAYRGQIQGYLRFLKDHDRDILSATRDDVISYLEKKKNAGLKTSSLFSSAIAIRQFHRFLAAGGRGLTDPCNIKLPKFKQRLPQPLGVTEMEWLLSVPTGTKFHRIRMRCALQIMWSTGMRVSEIVGLKLDQVNMEEGWVRVFGKGSKERLLPIGPKTKEELFLYMEAHKRKFVLGSNHLFLTSRGRPWTRGGFWWQMKKLAREAGVAGRVFPHRVRHSFGTHALLRGAPIRVVQEMMSHSSVQTTQRYTHVMVEDLRMALQTAHPGF